MWTIIGYIIATGATIIGTYYTYKSYKHMIQNRLEKNENKLLKFADLKPELEVKKIIVQSAKKTKDLGDQNFSPIVITIISSIKNISVDANKLTTLQILLTRYNSSFTAEEVYRIINLFSVDANKYYALEILVSRIQKPISLNTYNDIIKSFGVDANRVYASSILANLL